MGKSQNCTFSFRFGNAHIYFSFRKTFNFHFHEHLIFHLIFSELSRTIVCDPPPATERRRRGERRDRDSRDQHRLGPRCIAPVDDRLRIVVLEGVSTEGRRQVRALVADDDLDDPRLGVYRRQLELEMFRAEVVRNVGQLDELGRHAVFDRPLVMVPVRNHTAQADCARSLGPVDGEAYGRPVRSADDMVLVGLVVGKPDRPCVDLS